MEKDSLALWLGVCQRCFIDVLREERRENGLEDGKETWPLLGGSKSPYAMFNIKKSPEQRKDAAWGSREEVESTTDPEDVRQCQSIDAD